MAKVNATIDLNAFKILLDKGDIDQKTYDIVVANAIRLGGSISDFIDGTILNSDNPTKTKLELIYIAIKKLYPNVVNTTIDLPEFPPENILGSISKIVDWKERNVKDKNAEGNVLTNMVTALNKPDETELSLVDAIPTTDPGTTENEAEKESEEEKETDDSATIIKPKKK
jgi:hypothetical protein